MNLSPHAQQSKATPPLYNDIAALRDDLLSEKTVIPAQSIIPGELSEAFALLDPDLAYLHKDMKSAAAQLQLARKSGQMADMALWRFESAESAYKTRLMEVRKNKDISRCAKMALKCEETKAKRALRDCTMQDEMNRAFAARRKAAEQKRREKEQQGGWFFYLMLGIWLAQMTARNRARDMQLSSLQTHFFNARTGTV